MTTGATDAGRRTRGDDPLIGRGYVCCRGPHKRDTILVVGRIGGGTEAGRYQLEAERDGHSWTIDPERLARIFGESSKRRCGCFPLDGTVITGEAAARPETAAEATPPAAADTPAEDVPAAHEQHSATAAAVEPTGAPDAVTEITPAAGRGRRARVRPTQSAQEAAPSSVIFHEESRQGALF